MYLDGFINKNYNFGNGRLSRPLVPFCLIRKDSIIESGRLNKRILSPQTRLGSISALPIPSYRALAHHILLEKFCFLIYVVGITSPTHRATVLAAGKHEAWLCSGVLAREEW